MMTLKSSLTKKLDQYAKWLTANPHHPDYGMMWKEYNQLKKQQYDRRRKNTF